MAEVQQQLLFDNRKRKDSVDHLLNLQPSSQLDLFSSEDSMFHFHKNNTSSAIYITNATATRNERKYHGTSKLENINRLTGRFRW
jgi:hypothetical protein